MESYTLTFLSNALVAAIVSAIINVYWSHKLQINKDIETFRYNKLYELNIELNLIPSPNYKLNDAQSCLNQSTDMNEEIKKLFNKAEPLLIVENKKNMALLTNYIYY